MSDERLQRASRIIDLFSDPLRLRAIGKLVESKWTLAELTAELKAKPQAVARHIRALEDAGFILRGEDHPPELSFDVEHLREVAADLRPETKVEFEGSAVADARILQRFISNGRLTHLPSQRSRWLVILRWLVDSFEFGREYPEAEVNDILGAVHEDHALLRRQLVDEGLLARDHGIYWRVDTAAADDDPG